ncbi:MAG: PQQ-binding-like beta-propeller repeat protein [Alphaproteobacteria bacterium]|nr:PQQ-binding-like beta-propeller repeat protein [Alphaproteobacteria bacterium]
MNKNWLWPVLILALVACDATKIPITGTRVPVVDYESTIKVDEEAKSVSVSLPQSESNANWPQIGRDASHTMSNLAFSGASQPLWVSSIGGGNGAGRLLSPPIIQEGILYAMDTYGNVSALDASTGAELWRTDISPEGREMAIIGGGLAYGDGKIFVTSPHAEVLALDAKTGSILWRIPTLSPVRASPAYADGRLYVLTISNMLTVLEGESGKQLWEHAGITEFAGLLGTATPAVSKGVVIVTYSSGEIYALKADNGYQLWTETLSSTRRPDSLSALSHIRALPVIDDKKVIIVGHNQKMAAYDLRRGERSWERSIGGTRTPAVSGGYVFMVNSHNELVCLTRDFGQVVWIKKLTCDLEQPFKGFWEGPILAGGQLYLVSIHGNLLSLDPKNGKIIKEQNLGSPISLPPIVAQDTLFILTDNGDVMAFK